MDANACIKDIDQLLSHDNFFWFGNLASAHGMNQELYIRLGRQRQTSPAKPMRRTTSSKLMMQVDSIHLVSLTRDRPKRRRYQQLYTLFGNWSDFLDTHRDARNSKSGVRAFTVARDHAHLWVPMSAKDVRALNQAVVCRL